MSRSALWRQEANTKDRQRRADDTFRAAIEEGRERHVKGIIPLVGPDDTFNIHPVLLQTISLSPYFQRCCENLADWNSLVDEIYYEVKHVEPWTAGASKSPSTAFCLLLRLFTLRCTEKQMTLMLHHTDSPYIRCIGFLYLRYAADPSTLWSRFEPHLYDREGVQIRQGKADTTVGDYVRSLLEELEYHGTRLPRLPLALERQFKVKLLQAERIEERAKLHEKNKAAMEYFLRGGTAVQALYGDEENPVTWYDAVVDRVILRGESGELLTRPKFQVTFPEYGNTQVVGLGEIDLPGSHVGDDGVGGDMVTAERGRGRLEHSADQGRGYDDYRHTTDRRVNHDLSHRGGRDFDRPERSRSRDRSPQPKSREEEERELMQEVLRREREKSAAKGRAYAARPSGFRGVNADESVGGRHDVQDMWSAPKGRKEEREEKNVVVPVVKTAAELAAIEEKKRKLMAKYG